MDQILASAYQQYHPDCWGSLICIEYQRPIGPHEVYLFPWLHRSGQDNYHCQDCLETETGDSMQKVALVTADTYRIAAVDQLKTYANILSVPLRGDVQSSRSWGSTLCRTESSMMYCLD